MSKHNRLLIWISFLILIALLAGSGCSGSKQDQEVMNQVVEELTSEDDQETSADSDSETSPDTETSVDTETETDTEAESKESDTASQDEPEEPEIISFAAEYGDQFASVDVVTSTFGFADSKQNMEIQVDNLGDNLFGDPNVEPGGDHRFADISGWGYAYLEWPDDHRVPPPYEVLPPGLNDPQMNTWTVYPDPAYWQPYDGGQWYFQFIVLDENVPYTHEELTGTFALVTTINSDPEDNFVEHPQFPNDFNDGTDNWRWMQYNPETDHWIYFVTDAYYNEEPTSGFGIIHENMVGWFVPAGEIMDPMSYAMRMWVHWISANWDLHTSGADVILGDSNLPLVPVNDEPVVNPYELTVRDQDTIEGDYQLCDHSLCNKKHDFDDEMDINWCECNGCTNIAGCDCHLFVTNPLVPVTMENPGMYWSHAADPGERYDLQKHMWYTCLCVKEAE
jgi:hypothetical protein